MKRFLFIVALVAMFCSAAPCYSTNPVTGDICTKQTVFIPTCVLAAAPAVYYDNPFEWLTYRYVTYNDIRNYSPQYLRILRNSIYAMHGYIFKDRGLRNYFNQYAWYYPRYNNVDNRLSKIERANVAFIKKYE